MNKLNVIGVDLAKNVIQISVLSPSNQELLNSALPRVSLPSSWPANDLAWSPLKPVLRSNTGLASPGITARQSTFSGLAEEIRLVSP